MRRLVNLLFTFIFRLTIRIYQWVISPLLGPSCRYAPSCSSYMETAVRRFGPWAGGWMGFARLCRCHPWADWGCDPVPEHLPQGAQWYKPWRYGYWNGKHMHHPDEHQH